MWMRDSELAAAIAERGENPRYLPGVAIPDMVTATGDAEEAVRAADIVVVAVPSHGVEAVLAPIAPLVPSRAVVVSATKGLEPRRAWRMTELLAAIVPGRLLAVLSGPSFAREV